ncbi:MAG: flagellar M-ring protein FliF [Clostridia bacterium]|nr:flagellar M-ring protein FliF [Clostridia bacterium]
MNEQLKKIIDSIKTFWTKQSKKQKTMILSSAVGVLVLAIAIAAFMNRTQFVVLYPSLDSDEAIEVSQELSALKVEYREENGTIKVPQDQEESLRMELANSGHPRTAPNYDFFLENVDMMTTSQEREIIEKYQLDQKLSAVIQQIDGIKSATVTITLPKTEGYVLSSKAEDPATAGVTVTMTSKSKELSSTQVSGIKRLVASSVPSLDEEDVIVVDTATGNELSSSGSSSKTQLDVAQLKFIIESQFESEISNNVLKVLNPLFGEDNVKIAVKSVIDIDKKVQEIVTYNPSTDDNKGVISSEQTASEQEGATSSGGVPGTDSNMDSEELTTYPGVTSDGDTIYVKDEKAYEYLVSSVKEQVQKDSGELQDLTVSVVLNADTISETKREELSRLIANAAAVSPEKVVIYTDLFSSGATDDGKDSEPASSTNIFENYPWLLYVIIAAAGLLVVIILLVVVLKKRKKKKNPALGWDGTGTAPAQVNLETQSLDFDPAQLKEVQEIRDAKGQAMKKEIQEFSTRNPEIAAQLVRSWLKGDEQSV